MVHRGETLWNFPLWVISHMGEREVRSYEPRSFKRSFQGTKRVRDDPRKDYLLVCVNLGDLSLNYKINEESMSC